MKYNILVTGDIHFGYYPAELLYNEFKLIIKTIDEREIDAVVIAGDYYETRLSLSSPHSVYAIKAFSDLLKICECKNIKLRMIRGTSSHDPENQLISLATMANTTRCDFKLFNIVSEEELFPGFKVLYIPEEYMEDKDEYYKEYFDKKYNGIFGHGMFEETSFSSHVDHSMKKYPIFNSSFMESICDGPIVFGHIHKSQTIRERIIYTGSLTRSKFGEEEDKGFIISTYDTNSKETNHEFIVNEAATRYDTIEITSKSPIFTMLLNDQIIYLRDLINKYKRDKLRIKISIPDDYNNTTAFIDSANNVFNDDKNIQLNFIENRKEKMQKEAKEKVDLLMTKYGFIFDKTVPYDLKIQQFLKIKKGKDISIEKIRQLIAGNK